MPLGSGKFLKTHTRTIIFGSFIGKYIVFKNYKQKFYEQPLLINCQNPYRFGHRYSNFKIHYKPGRLDQVADSLS